MCVGDSQLNQALENLAENILGCGIHDCLTEGERKKLPDIRQLEEEFDSPPYEPDSSHYEPKDR